MTWKEFALQAVLAQVQPGFSCEPDNVRIMIDKSIVVAIELESRGFFKLEEPQHDD